MTDLNSVQLQAHNAAMASASDKHMKDIKEEAKKLAAMAELHKKEMMQHSKALADLAAKHEAEMRNQMTSHEDSLKTLKQENARLRDELAKAMQRATSSEAEFARINAELERKKGEFTTLSQRVAQAESGLKEVDSLKQKIGSLHVEIQGYQNDRRELEAARKAFAEAQADATRSRELLGTLEQSSKQFEREKMEYAGQIKAAQDAAAKTAGINEQLQAEILEQKSNAARDAEKMKDLQARLEKMHEFEQGILLSRKTVKDLEECVAVLRAENERLVEAFEQSKSEVQKLRAFKSEMLTKYASMERNLQDQIFDLVDERNTYKGELEHFYSLPNPCGVGLGLRSVDVVESHSHSLTSTVTVIDILPGMSAAQSGMIAIGDLVTEVEGMSTSGKTTDEIKTAIAGKRGTRIKITFRRPSDLSDYTIVLKRGAWGPDHCAVTPEHMDMVDEGRWPSVKSRTSADRSIDNSTSFKGDY